MPLNIAPLVISNFFKKPDPSKYSKDLLDSIKRIYNVNPILFEAWFESFFLEYRGRFSDVTGMWPVPDSLINVGYILQWQALHMYNYNGTIKTNRAARNYDLIKGLVSAKGKSDGMLYNQGTYPPEESDAYIDPKIHPNGKTKSTYNNEQEEGYTPLLGNTGSSWIIYAGIGLVAYFLLKK